jgi:hypothetical protein
MLVAVWDASTKAVAARAASVVGRRESGAATLNKLTREFLRGEPVGQGDRHRRTYSAAANLAEIGCPLAVARLLLTEPALDLGLPPKDVARCIDNAYGAAS